ncbi:MAG: enoyl-CoA hydratase/isomerase family protein [Streptosporangiales bacterium]|nr:enoyl-CoA hydratase/isomerase family protein [Streptosporangiales bacterium]
MTYDEYEFLEISRRERVLTIALNRPEKLNAINGGLHEELSRVFDDLNRDRDIDVAILTGAGRAFCAGGDADWLDTLIEDPLGWEQLSEENRRTMMGILECRQPIIAKLNGTAAGLGATLALFCDVVIASDKAKIGDPHVKVGLVAGDGGSAIWPYLIGYARAREFLYTGELLTAQRAADIGLINRCVPADELDAEVDAFADQLANGAIRAIQWTKQAVNAPLREIVAQNLELSLALEAKSNLTVDHQEGINALREKRPAKFVGR